MRKRSRRLVLAARDKPRFRRDRSATRCASEIALALLLFHRGRLRHGRSGGPGAREVRAAAFRATISGERRRRRFDRAGERIAAQRAEAHESQSPAVSPGASGMRSSSTMISAPSRSTTGRSRGEIERHDRNLLEQDVLPDVEFGPVGQREDADRFRPWLHAGVVELPELRALVLRVPACCAVRKEKMRSLARLFSSSRRAPPNAASKPYLVERLLQRLGLHHMGVQRRAVVERVDAAPRRRPG